MQYTYLIGADPELFLVNGSGAFVSAHDVIPGDKNAPFNVHQGAIQVDGVAAEFNIYPAKTASEFMDNIKTVLREMSDRIETKNPDLSLIVSPTATFEEKYFKKLPKSAKLLGCTPDMNVYMGQKNPPPATKEPFRTGAGHIHVGWTSGELLDDGYHEYDCRQMVKQLDSVLYPMSCIWDQDSKRRELYGKIGAYRVKHYGVEYRCLSNAWVADPDLQYWVFETTKKAAEMLDNGDDIFGDEILQSFVIDTHTKGGTPERPILLELHDYLHSEFGFLELPQAYLK